MFRERVEGDDSSATAARDEADAEGRRESLGGVDGASFVGAADVLLRHARGGFEFARRLGGGLTRIAKRRHQTGPRLGARIEGFVGERDGPGDPGGVGCGRGEEA